MIRLAAAGRSRPLRAALLLAAALAGGVYASGGLPARAAEGVFVIPPPSIDEKATASSETAVLAGGCFWGIQGVFQHVKGVSNAVSGYSGGDAQSAHYTDVGTGTTGHAESVQITFDPRVISYGTLLRIYFSVAHDPTELDRQGPDTGTQYRSAIFAKDAQQKRIAEAYVKQLGESGAYSGPIVTEIAPLKGFYPAEAYHQDFLVRNPDYPYIVYNDLPKVENLRKTFPDLYRAAPVLVADAKG